MLNKKFVIRISLFVTATLLIAWGVVSLLEYLSWKNVTFKLSSDTSAITVYDSQYNPNLSNQPEPLVEREGTGVIRLKPGRYSVVPTGDTIVRDVITIDITGDTREINIDPYRTSDYLEGKFSGEIDTITKVIQQKYPSIISGYTIKKGRFYHFGEWYVTTLYNTNPTPRMGTDIYSIITKKDNGVWSVVANPKIVFSYKDFPAIPKDIVDIANQTSSGISD